MDEITLCELGARSAASVVSSLLTRRREMVKERAKFLKDSEEKMEDIDNQLLEARIKEDEAHRKLQQVIRNN